jgi:hypothetical protein
MGTSLNPFHLTLKRGFTVGRKAKLGFRGGRAPLGERGCWPKSETSAPQWEAVFFSWRDLHDGLVQSDFGARDRREFHQRGGRRRMTEGDSKLILARS